MDGPNSNDWSGGGPKIDGRTIAGSTDGQEQPANGERLNNRQGSYNWRRNDGPDNRKGTTGGRCNRQMETATDGVTMARQRETIDKEIDGVEALYIDTNANANANANANG